MYFEACSGLKVNARKSSLITVGEVQHIEEWAVSKEFQVNKLAEAIPWASIGIYTQGYYSVRWVGRKVREEDEILEKTILVKMGQVTMVKSILSSLPTYFMSLFPLPASFEKKLGKIQRNFLWDGMEEVSLNQMGEGLHPMQSGSLGIKLFRMFNQALRSKWLCMYGCERNALWRKIIDYKYVVEEGDWMSEVARESHGWGCGKASEILGGLSRYISLKSRR